MNRLSRATLGALMLLGLGGATITHAQQSEMTFFITSAGSGKGGDLSGLAGADKQCQVLAQAAGAGGKTWHAYLSTQGASAVSARDRIGAGPWQNAKGTVIAKNLTELHSANNNITKQTALNEKGEVVNGRGDTPNMHDILTGSQPDGTAFAAGDDRTCGNWTKSGHGAAMVGHHDRQGLRDDDASKSWNSSHTTRGPDGGCSQNDLKSTGGNGLFYCFATKYSHGEHRFAARRTRRRDREKQDDELSLGRGGDRALTGRARGLRADLRPPRGHLAALPGPPGGRQSRGGTAR